MPRLKRDVFVLRRQEHGPETRVQPKVGLGQTGKFDVLGWPDWLDWTRVQSLSCGMGIDIFAEDFDDKW